MDVFVIVVSGTRTTSNTTTTSANRYCCGPTGFKCFSYSIVTVGKMTTLASIGAQCSNTLKWIMNKAAMLQQNSTSNDTDFLAWGETVTDSERKSQGAITISHSLPDLQTTIMMREPMTTTTTRATSCIGSGSSAASRETPKSVSFTGTEQSTSFYKKGRDGGRVLRQTTLPIVPTRLQTFQRQLSHRFDLPQTEIEFSICSLKSSARRESCTALGSIQPELYENESGHADNLDEPATATSLADTTADSLEKCGNLYFSLRYDNELEGLIVKILEARNLPIKDAFGTSDPYVKIYLLPERKKKYQTKVHRRNLNPIFNEVFIFSIACGELSRSYLQFSVYDFDRFSRHDLIGHVFVRGLHEIADFDREIEYTMDILCPLQEKANAGELMLSLCYLPKAGRLTLTVLKARNLKAMDICGKSDPYVKVYLICQEKRIKKKKTSVKKSTLNPVYNEALLFDIPAENICDVTLIVKVIDYDRIRPNELIGCTMIGSKATGIGRDCWIEMQENPRIPIAHWYPLTEAAVAVTETDRRQSKSDQATTTTEAVTATTSLSHEKLSKRRQKSPIARLNCLPPQLSLRKSD